jgi:vitamin B12 transporter
MREVIHTVIHTLFLFALLSLSSAYSQIPLEVRGFVYDSESSSALEKASLTVTGSTEGPIETRSDGSFLLRIQRIPFSISVSKSGYRQEKFDFLMLPDSMLRIRLEPHTYPLGEIVVTGTKLPVSAASGPSSVSVISKHEIEQKPGGSLGALFEGLPGVYVRSYGNASAIQTVSLRGMYAEHTLVLIDGQRYNSFQNGLTDFGILSTLNVERVEVVKGGLSPQYGTDAVGGVINIITKRPSPKIAAEAESFLGSNGLYGQEIAVSGSHASSGWQATLRSERGSGDYKYRFEDGTTIATLRRGGADFSLLTSTAHLEQAFAENVRSALSLSYAEANRGAPGPVTQANSSGSARLADHVGRLQFVSEWKTSALVTAKLNSSFLYSRETYRDPQLVTNGVPLENSYTNRDFSISPELQFTFSPAVSGILGAEVAHGWLLSSEVNDANRWQQSVFAAVQQSFILPFDVPFEAVLYPSVRYDHFSDVRGDVSPNLGLNVGILKEPQLRLRSSIAKSFRVPTFNELYWRNGGNPLLSPERSLNVDCGLASTFEVFGVLTLDASYFSIMTTDRIVWSPGSGGIWSPRNIANVESKGVEAQARWIGSDDAFSVTVNSTWTYARKRSEDFPGDPTKDKYLLYVPQQVVNVSGSLKIDPFTVYVQHSWISFRYASEMNDLSMPAYSLTGATVRYTLKLGSVKAFIKVEGTNLFNNSYQVFPSYPMPLAEFRGTVGAEL